MIANQNNISEYIFIFSYFNINIIPFQCTL